MVVSPLIINHFRDGIYCIHLSFLAATPFPELASDGSVGGPVWRFVCLRVADLDSR